MIKHFNHLLLVLSTLFIVACGDLGTEKNYNGTQLFYTSDITDAEADKVGEYLVSSGFADGQEKTVQLAKTGGTYEFKMVVKKGLEQDQEYATLFKNFAAEMSRDVFGGAQVDLHACDENLETLRVFPMAME
ncbi:MAG: hypothetical protein KDC59_23235 [Saprospiraceae bacterium]|nr:hypothetical protein [Saprospiraceae bacterium]MCB9318690.1 hypothetical protein [Lewinellaceae bacterium]HQU55392.1 hypothetical protein [Saprospiraceae bacterium]